MFPQQEQRKMEESSLYKLNNLIWLDNMPIHVSVYGRHNLKNKQNKWQIY